jgi:hypothetical protein
MSSPLSVYATISSKRDIRLLFPLFFLFRQFIFLDTICIYIISMSDDVSLVGQELLALSQDMSYPLVV